jgi:hypothetical protein
VKPGAVFIAQSSAPKIHEISLEVIAGDQIKALKHVSSTPYFRMNLRTKQMGQFRESIFKKDAAAQLIEHQQQIIKKNEAAAVRPRVSSISTTVSKRLDRVEHMNATEWDEVPIVTRPKTVAPAPSRPSAAVLTTSRFAVLADMDSKSERSEQQDVQGMTREEVDRLFEEKV